MSFLKKAQLAIESGTAIISNIAAGEPIAVDDAEAERRMDVCKTCPSYVETLDVPRCNDCGCLMSLKTKLADMKCPQDKW